MRRLASIIMTLATWVVVLALAGVLGLQYYLRAEFFEDIVVEFLEESTGGQATVENLRVSWWPGLSIHCGPVSVTNPKGFDSLLVTGKEVRVDVSLPSLLVHELVISKVAVGGGVLTLVQRGNSTNFQPFLDYLAEDTVRDGYIREVFLDGLDVNGSQVRLDLDQGKAALCAFSLEGGKIRVGEPIDYHTAFSVWDGSADSREMGGTFDLAGHIMVGADAGLQYVVIDRGTAMGDCPVDPLKGEPVTARFKARWAPGEDGIRIKDYDLDAIGTIVSGKGQLGLNLAKPWFSGQVRASSLNPSKVFPRLIPMLEGNPLLPTTGSFKGRMRVNAQGLKVDQAELVLGTGKVTGQATLKNYVRPVVRFDLDTDAVNGTWVWARAMGNATKEAALDLEALRGVDVGGALDVDALELPGLSLRGVDFEVSARRGFVGVSSKVESVLGGEGALELSLTGPASKVRTSFNATLDKVAATELAAFTGLAQNAAGTLNATASGAFTGTSLESVARNLGGECLVELGPGFVEVATNATAPKADKISYSEANATISFAAPANATTDIRRVDVRLGWRDEQGHVSASGRFIGPVSVGGGQGPVCKDMQAKVLISWPGLPEKHPALAVSGTLDADVNSGTARVDDLAVSLLGARASGMVNATGLGMGSHVVAGHLDLVETAPFDHLRHLGIARPSTPDSAAFSRLSIGTDFRLTPDRLLFYAVRGQLDFTEFSGLLEIKDFDNPRYRFDLKGSILNLDRYLVPSEERPARKTNFKMPFRELTEAVVNGEIKLDYLNYRDLSVTKFTCLMRVHPDYFIMNPVTGRFYGGEYRGSFVMEDHLDHGIYKAWLLLEGFEAETMVNDILGRPYLTGNATMFFDLQSRGVDRGDLIKHLKGHSGLKVEDGSYKFTGWDRPPAPEKSDMDVSPIAPKPQPAKANKGTSFYFAKSNSTVRSGVFRNRDFLLEGPTVTITGDGDLDIPDNTIDVNLKADFIVGPTVPVSITGKLSDPKISVPTSLLVGEAIKTIISLPLKPFQFVWDIIH